MAAAAANDGGPMAAVGIVATHGDGTVVVAFVGLRSSCRPTPGLSVLMLETRSTLNPRDKSEGEGNRRQTLASSR